MKTYVNDDDDAIDINLASPAETNHGVHWWQTPWNWYDDIEKEGRYHEINSTSTVNSVTQNLIYTDNARTPTANENEKQQH